MKLMCTIVGCLIVLIVVIVSPWPHLVFDVASKIQALPEAADDVVYHTIVKVISVAVAYVLFPLLGAALGYLVGYILVRRLD